MMVHSAASLHVPKPHEVDTCCNELAIIRQPPSARAHPARAAALPAAVTGMDDLKAGLEELSPCCCRLLPGPPKLFCKHSTPVSFLLLYVYPQGWDTA